jgi:hypothetical protein
VVQQINGDPRPHHRRLRAKLVISQGPAGHMMGPKTLLAELQGVAGVSTKEA